MQIYFAGAEVPSHLAVLRQCGVTRVAVSITNLARTAPDLETWATRKRLDGLEWVLYADGPHTPVSPALEVLKGAEVQPEIVTGPIEWYEQTWLSNSDLLFLPTWDASDPSVLRDYTENYDGVTLPDSVVDNPTAVRQARAAINRLGQLAALTGRSKGIERFDTLVSSAWWAVQKYGETQVWAVNRLVRLNAEDKERKRERYADAIRDLGCDYDKLLMDDPVESVVLAVRSWQALEQHLVKGRPVERGTLVTPGQSGQSSAIIPALGSVASGASGPRHHLLPVIGTGTASHTVTDDQGNEVETQVTTIQVRSESLRQCNTCSLALACPMHTQNAACSYNIPVTIQSKPQLMGVMRAITEIEGQRIMMMRFAEEINGQTDPDLGKEMDRFFSMVAKWREIEDNRDTVRMTLESKGDGKAAMGVLSRLFGSTVGQNAVLLDEPVSSDEIIDAMEGDD